MINKMIYAIITSPLYNKKLVISRRCSRYRRLKETEAKNIQLTQTEIEECLETVG